MTEPYAEAFLVDDLPIEIVAQMRRRDEALEAAALDAGGGLEFIIDTTRRWPPGSVLRVAFQDGNDEQLALIDGVKSGLSLLTTAQPALLPLTKVVMGLAQSALTRHDNLKVQDFHLGLDFNPQGTGVGLRLGSYVVVQVPEPGAVDWASWVFDRQRETIVHAQDGSLFPCNYLLFRLSPHTQPSEAHHGGLHTR
jgi:hypothetical protein